MNVKRSSSDSSPYREHDALSRSSPDAQQLETAHRIKSVEIYEKYVLALKEIDVWKKKYQDVTDKKLNDMSKIQSNLMLLEARLQAEKKEIEAKFVEQRKLIQKQKLKIESLATVNHKLINGLMVLRKQTLLNKQNNEDINGDDDETDANKSSHLNIR